MGLYRNKTPVAAFIWPFGAIGFFLAADGGRIYVATAATGGQVSGF
jgi:hypothetical protein